MYVVRKNNDYEKLTSSRAAGLWSSIYNPVWTGPYAAPSSARTILEIYQDTVFYGINSDNYDCYLYDPITDTWSSAASFISNPRNRAFGAVVGNEVIVGGGQNVGNLYNDILAYNMDTNTWRSLTTIQNTARTAIGAVGLNGYLYLVGGCTDYQSEFPVAGVWRYDVAGNTWTQLADMPAAKGQHICEVINGKIYAIGGYYGSFIHKYVDNKVYRYDPALDEWTTLSNGPFTHGTSGRRCGISDGRLWVTGMSIYNTSGYPNSRVYSYYPGIDTWVYEDSCPAPWATANFQNVSWRGDLFAINGTDLRKLNI